MTYNDVICVIQDCTSRRLIGVGEEKGGAFWFKKINILSTLWHKHLGHPSNQVNSLLPKSLGVFNSITNKEDHPCDIYFRAKQTCNSFNISESKAKDLFEIIDCDIWVVIEYLLFVVHIISLPLWMMRVGAYGWF